MMKRVSSDFIWFHLLLCTSDIFGVRAGRKLAGGLFIDPPTTSDQRPALSKWSLCMNLSLVGCGLHLISLLLDFARSTHYLKKQSPGAEMDSTPLWRALSRSYRAMRLGSPAKVGSGHPAGFLYPYLVLQPRIRGKKLLPGYATKLAGRWLPFICRYCRLLQPKLTEKIKRGA